MTNPDNEETEPFPFLPLATFAARVLTGSTEQNQNRAPDRAAAKYEEEQAEQHRAHVDQGLRQIAAFERRARGLKRW